MRRASIPVEHFETELAVYPLVSETSLRVAITSLDPSLKDPSTGRLWRAAERECLAAGPSFSVDEAIAVRDRLWFGEESSTSSLLVYMERLAKNWLEPRGAFAIPKERRGGASAALARSHWRWVSFAIPPDTLLAALTPICARGSDRVRALSPILERTLEAGFAETHLHVGAGLRFPDLWASAMIAVGLPEFKPETLCSPGAPFDEGNGLSIWLLRAAIARTLLAGFLRQPPRKNLANYLRGWLPRFADRKGVLIARDAEQMILDFTCGKAEGNREFGRLQKLYRQMCPRIRVGESLGDLQVADPIACILGDTSSDSTELELMHRGMGYLRREPCDGGFATLFWQTIRVRNLVYRHIVQRPMTPGLQWFTRFYDRIRALRKGMNAPVRVASAIRLSGLGKGLRSFEFRTAPDNSLNALRTELRQADEILREHTQRDAIGEYGAVLHFVRTRGGRFGKGLPEAHWRGSNADPCWDRSPLNLGFRFGKHYEDLREKTLVWARLMCRYPAHLGLIRGVDACTDEAGVPTWVVAPLFRYLQRVSRQASRILAQRGHCVPPIRTSVHCGEDFMHLMTGLRRIHEAIAHLGVAEGDRLGHALALGVDPTGWITERTRVCVSLEDRLFDLLAAQEMGARVNDAELEKCGRRMFGKPCTPIELRQLVADLYNPCALLKHGFPGRRQLGQALVHGSLLSKYFCDPAVFERGKKTQWIDTRPDEERLIHMQQRLRQAITGGGITVEVNPSSNLLVGNLGDLKNHPLWKLRPIRDEDVQPIPLCIGSDDPLTFATSLREEYQLLEDALSIAGVSNDRSLAWIDEVRRQSLAARFTLPPLPFGLNEVVVRGIGIEEMLIP